MHGKINNIVFDLKNFIFRLPAVLRYQLSQHNESMTKREVAELNFSKRVQIVTWAYQNSLFYRKLYDSAGFKPSELKNESDWMRVPVVTKDDLRLNFDDIKVSSLNRRGRISSTGGSTGKPLKVLHDRSNYLDIFSWRVYRWWGLRRGCDAAYVFRDVRSNRLKSFLNAIIWWPTHRILIDASSISDTDLKIFVQKIKRRKPSLIQGYTGAIIEIAKFIEREGVDISNVRAVWVTASPLTAASRRLIENAFKAPVYDQYGSGEIYWIAAECEKQTGLHIFEDARYVEILDSNQNSVPDGNSGSVVVTDLWNKVFPLIRYSNGDISSISKDNCSCGVNFKRLNKIEGRISDVIHLIDGGFIAGEYLTTIFDDYIDFVNLFQVRQLENSNVIITISFKDGVSKNEKLEIVNKVDGVIRPKLSDNMVLSILEDPDFSNLIKGKNRFVVSDYKRSIS